MIKIVNQELQQGKIVYTKLKILREKNINTNVDFSIEPKV